MITIHFYLRFHSTYGQSFYISGNIPELGNNDVSKAIPIQYLNDDYWQGSVDIKSSTGEFEYKYILKNPDGFETIESKNDRYIDPSKIKTTEIQVMDTWN